MSREDTVYTTEAMQQFATERLFLRPARRGDVAPLHDAIVETLDDLVRWLPWARARHTRADTRAYVRGARTAFARRSAFEYVVCDAKTEAVVGVTSLHRIDWIRRSAGVGYWIRRSRWDQGCGREAVGATLLHAFTALRLHRLEAHIALANTASQRLAESLGFRREGVARDVEFIDGRYLDHLQYSLLEPEFAASEAERPASSGGLR